MADKKESESKPDGRIPSRSETDLRSLARDYVEGHIFTDRQVSNPSDIGMVFMVVMLGGIKPELEYSKKHSTAPDSLGLLYEEMSKAGPRAINGMPMFLSVNVLSRGDTEKMFQFTKEYEAITKAFTAGPIDRDDNAASDHGPKQDA